MINEVRGEIKDGVLKICLSGRIDSNNAPDVEAAIMETAGGQSCSNVVVDAQDLVYISSAGLRVLLHLRKMCSDIRVTGVNPSVYEIFEMTGFTQMLTVEKAYRVVSVEGCEVIGQGANGKLYRIDEDNVVKVYKNADALADIQHEREVARLALVLGIPTAISYDVVRVGDSYGSVFELLNASSFAKIIANEPEKLDWCVDEYVEMLLRIHNTEVPEGELPDMRATAIDWVDFLKEYLPEESYTKLKKLVEDVPKDNHMLHGDYHTKNLELQGDEVLLIDMDTLAVGYPVFELGSMFNAYIGFSELNPGIVKEFQGFDRDTATDFWHKVLIKYLGTDDENVIRDVEDKARIIGYTRLIRRSIRRNGLNDPAKKAEIDHWRTQLVELIDRTDTLLFTRSEMEIDARKENLDTVIEFLNEHLSRAGAGMKLMLQMDMVVEEMFINIASYAYPNGPGKAWINIKVVGDPKEAVITLSDTGIPYDPLKKEDPDVTLSAEERQIGGLGIYMVKQSVDKFEYEYKDRKNIVTLKKAIV